MPHSVSVSLNVSGLPPACASLGSVRDLQSEHLSASKKVLHTVPAKQFLTRPLLSLPLVRVPGSLMKEWNNNVCLTLMSGVKLTSCSTKATLSASLAG